MSEQECRQPIIGELAPALQLLVIDLGDSFVFKVERGDGSTLYDYPLETGRTCHISNGDTLADLRAALEDKPVPRIESNGEGGYHFIVAGSEDSWLTGAEYDALCEIAGHKLPVYEGGKWEQIMEGVGEHTASDVLRLPIWRYRR